MAPAPGSFPAAARARQVWTQRAHHARGDQPGHAHGRAPSPCAGRWRVMDSLGPPLRAATRRWLRARSPILAAMGIPARAQGCARRRASICSRSRPARHAGHARGRLSTKWFRAKSISSSFIFMSLRFLFGTLCLLLRARDARDDSLRVPHRRSRTGTKRALQMRRRPKPDVRSASRGRALAGPPDPLAGRYGGPWSVVGASLAVTGLGFLTRRSVDRGFSTRRRVGPRNRRSPPRVCVLVDFSSRLRRATLTRTPSRVRGRSDRAYTRSGSICGSFDDRRSCLRADPRAARIPNSDGVDRAPKQGDLRTSGRRLVAGVPGTSSVNEGRGERFEKSAPHVEASRRPGARRRRSHRGAGMERGRSRRCRAC